MIDSNNYLSPAESEALTNDALRQHAKAIDTFLALAALTSIPEPRIAQGVEAIRDTDKAQAKKLRKHFMQTIAALAELLPDAPVVPEETSETLETVRAVEEREVVPDDVAAEETSGVAEEETPEVLTAVEAAEEAVVDNDEVSASPAGTVEVPEAQKPEERTISKWAQDALGDYSEAELREMSSQEIAELIYKQAGSPPTRRQQNGYKANPVERIRRRVEGVSISEIAERDGTSPAAISQWFIKMGQRARHQDISETPNETQAHGVLIASESEKSDEAQAVTPAAEVEAPHPVAAPSPLLFSRRQVEVQVVPDVDHAALAKGWAEEMELDYEQTEALQDVLDPNYSLELNGIQRQVRHRFRTFITERLPQLESDELGLDTNEIARLNYMFGRAKTSEGYRYQEKPHTVHQAAMDHGYFVPSRRNEALSALQKVSDFLSRQSEGTETAEENLDQLVGTLEAAGLDGEEIEALTVCLQFDEEGRYRERPEAARRALRQLESFLIAHVADLRDADPRIAPSLRMLTNTALGVKTLDDVYEKLRARDAGTTKEQVVNLIRDGIVTLGG